MKIKLNLKKIRKKYKTFFSKVKAYFREIHVIF